MWWNWTTGEKFTAAKLNSFKTAYKAIDQTVTNSTTLVNDDDLLFSIGANETWGFIIFMLFSGTTGGDLKASLTFPSGAVTPWGRIGANTSIAYDGIGFDAPVSGSSNFGFGGNGAGNTMTSIIFGTCFNSITAGSVRLQFAQATAAPGEVARMRKGSNLFAYRMD